MASRLLRVSGALRALRVGPAPLGKRPGPLAAAGSRDASTGGMAIDEEQATGMERKVLDTIKKGVDPFGVFPSKPYGGTKDDPHLVPSLTNVRLVGCICEEDATETYYIWLHKDKMERCPSCGAHFKLVPCELP
ncbi:cytochrome c oxidase subunit 5B, mitochondrial [Ahaetulla prasina]|uniref:cytochrome c oxidase subunit 5B, mitochondrial n=1 Tax=Ahaetulla prasina TaxID=499056 RepID=UPI00264786DD|nr:cytochrome c oxidase subunit 5B, mitochondrial [Ahaetulla prasina]